MVLPDFAALNPGYNFVDWFSWMSLCSIQATTHSTCVIALLFFIEVKTKYTDCVYLFPRMGEAFIRATTFAYHLVLQLGCYMVKSHGQLVLVS